MRILALLAASAALVLTPNVASAQSSGRKAQVKESNEIPICQRKLGTIAVQEPKNNWWNGLGLSSPESIIKLFVMKSGCFGLVDRGAGLEMRNTERALADSGELQRGSNIGRGQVKAADYFIVPDLVTKNNNSGGFNLGGAAGALFGGTVGAIAGGVNVKRKEANVILTLVNARTTEQERMTEGYYRKTDIGFAGGGGAGWWGGFGALGGSTYQNTDIGQVVVLAYLRAYKDLVQQLGGLPLDPSGAAPQAAR
jgi:hypothetical protein